MTALHELAAELGVDTEWCGVDGRTNTVTDDTLLAVCASLTTGMEAAGDAAEALRARRADNFAAGTEPVLVAWDTTLPCLVVYRRRDHSDGALQVTIEREDGTVESWRGTDCAVRAVGPGPVRDTVAVEVTLPRALPYGAHALAIEGPGLDAHAVVLAAPSRPAGIDRSHRWGIFAPVYALHDRERRAAGDFGSLRRFAAWAGRYGADLVGTLPVLATFVGHGREPRDTSPYAPVSRRFWNEAYLDLRAIDSSAAVDRDSGPGGPNADLVTLAARTRAALAPFAEAAAANPALRRWLVQRPDVADYARFRAKVEGGGEDAVRYHQYAQWCCDKQLTALAAELRGRGQSLFLDFPIGSHHEGFDVAHEGALFVRDASVGAPPDAFYATGQNWGFPPVDPHAARLDGHAYFRSCLDAHFRFAQDLRIDHVMGLHRLWFIPPGADGSDGAYVRYAGEEQWAALCIEAHRYGGTIVGENLGTVPEATNRALREHRALGMWVLQFETPPTAPVLSPTATQLACLDTHDLPPFATWWTAITPAHRQVVIDTLRIGGALESRDEPDAATVLGAIYRWLGASDAAVVIAALEDLWLETEPQNRPGTPSDENFRHRGTYGFDELDLDDVAVGDALVDATRALRLLDDARAAARSSRT
jgi:4-alpha-glucanotransferase